MHWRSRVHIASPDAFPLGFDETLFASRGDHIAYFWESEADFARGVKFCEVGLNARDHCVLFGHQEANANVLQLLRSHGFAVDELIRQRQLIIHGGQTTGHASLAQIGATFTELLGEGATRLRLLGNIGWGRPEWPSEPDLVAFETNVTEAIRELPCVVVCMYDVRSLPQRLVVEPGFKAHPFTIFPKSQESRAVQS